MADFNTGKVTLDFKDAHRRPIRDSVRLTFDNFHVKSLNFRRTVEQFPVTLEGVPANPTGTWQVFVQPERYRPKSFFINVPSNDEKICEEFFFLHSSKARPIFPVADQVFSDPMFGGLATLLNNSTIGGRTGRALYERLVNHEPLAAAGLLNLHGRTQLVTLDSGKKVFAAFENLALILQDRIYTTVTSDLHDDVLKSVIKKILDPVDGSLHEFPIPGNFLMLTQDASFKTPEKAGNLQLTFAADAGGNSVVDADVDEAKGIAHAFEVLGHIFTGGRTHPYDIHQILTFFYHDVMLGYDVVPA